MMLGHLIHECILLHVEDDDGTAFLFQKALHERIPCPKLFRVADGEQAEHFLWQSGVYGDAPRPHVVMLDLNLPRRNGFEILAQMKGTPGLGGIPVVVFTTSTLLRDRQKALELGAVEYVNKGLTFDSFVEAAELVCRVLSAQTTSGVPKI